MIALRLLRIVTKSADAVSIRWTSAEFWQQGFGLRCVSRRSGTPPQRRSMIVFGQKVERSGYDKGTRLEVKSSNPGTGSLVNHPEVRGVTSIPSQAIGDRFQSNQWGSINHRSDAPCRVIGP